MSLENVNLINTLYPNNDFDETLTNSPTSVYPIVTLDDVKDSYMTRYFARLISDKTTICEIDSLQYEKFKKNSRFIVTKLRWKIVGIKKTTYTSYGAKVLGVEDINRKNVSEADLTFGGLTSYISDYTQFWYSEYV